MGGRTPLDDALSQGEALAEAGVPSTSIILERVPTSKSIFQQSEVPDATPHGPTPPGKLQADTSDAEDDEQPHAALLVPETPRESRSAHVRRPRSRRPAREPLSSRDRALWHWANMDDLDTFLRELYGYYVGKGFWCILLARLLHLLTIAFVLGFSTFLGGCIDYSAIRHDGELSEAIVPHCVTRLSKVYFILFVMVASMFGWQAILFGISIRRLLVLRDVYTHLLEIPPADVATIPWHEVVQRLTRLAAAHPTLAFSYRDGVPFDALSVANRIMRQDNYLVALVNRELLDVDLPIPRGMWLAGPLRSVLPGLTKAFEWNLRFCVLGFVFTPQGRFRRQFLQREYRADLINGCVALPVCLLTPACAAALCSWRFSMRSLHRSLCCTWWRTAFSGTLKSTTRTPPRLAPGSTRHLRTGSSASTTSCRTCSSGGATRVTSMHAATWSSSPTTPQRSSQGTSRPPSAR